MGFFDTNHTHADHLNFRFPRVDEIAEKLNEYISNNRMDEIEKFVNCFSFTSESASEWISRYGGLEAIRKWRKFDKHRDIEEKNWPNAYHFKRECIYNLDNYEQQTEINAEAGFPDDVNTQEAEIISVDIPTPPIERIANAMERINGKIPEQGPEYTKYLVDKGLLYPDGKRVIKSLDDVAMALKDFINKDDGNSQSAIPQKEISVTWEFLRQTFLKDDGKPYSEKSCKDAVRMSNYNTYNTP
jgi:hypothetical protein